VSSTTGATGYFLFSSILRSISATVILTMALFGLMCYLNVTMTEERRLSTVTRDPELSIKVSSVVE
jgi:hypothetical protein